MTSPALRCCGEGEREKEKGESERGEETESSINYLGASPEKTPAPSHTTTSNFPHLSVPQEENFHVANPTLVRPVVILIICHGEGRERERERETWIWRSVGYISRLLPARDMDGRRGRIGKCPIVIGGNGIYVGSSSSIQIHVLTCTLKLTPLLI